MKLPLNESYLEDRTYVTLILRLALDQEGQLTEGELVDTIGSIPKRFNDLDNLEQAVGDWLKQISKLYGSSFSSKNGESKK